MRAASDGDRKADGSAGEFELEKGMYVLQSADYPTEFKIISLPFIVGFKHKAPTLRFLKNL